MSKKNKPIRVKLLVNPGAGKVQENAAKLEKVIQYLQDAGLKVDIALAHPKKKIIPIAKRAIKKGYNFLIAMGGDGTIAAVIRAIGKSKVTLGIIPAGTSNDIAASMGIPEDLEKACALIAAGHTRKIDLGQISTKDRKNFNFPMVAAVGLTASLYPEISDIPDGDYSGVKNAIMTFLKYDTKPTVYLTLNDESKIDVQTMLVTIANAPVAGLKNSVAPDAIMDDGVLDIAVYPDFSKAELISYFVRSANEGTMPDGRIRRYRAKKIKIKTDPKLAIAAEGIIVGKGTCWIKVLPKALRVISPEPGAGAEKPTKEAIKDLPEPVSPITK